VTAVVEYPDRHLADFDDETGAANV